MPKRGRRPFKPARDTICALKLVVGEFTPKEFRAEAGAVSTFIYDAGEVPGFFKWAKRYKLIEPRAGGRYVTTAKGRHVAQVACNGPKGGFQKRYPWTRR